MRRRTHIFRVCTGIVATWVALAGLLPAQPATSDPIHAIVLHGIDSLYNLRIEGAEASFDEAIRIAPDDPRGWFFKSMVHFYIYQLTQDKASYDRFFELSETVIDRAEAVEDRDDTDLMAKFYLGGIYGYRGLAFQRNSNLLSALWDGRKGYGYLREAATGPIYSIDAKMGFGLFTYLVSKIPRSFSWVFNILGFSGDLEGGLRMIQAAADSGVYTRTEAAFYFAQFCFFEERYDIAYVYMQRIMDQYPRNSLFLVTFAAWELRQDRIDEAIAIGERAIEVNRRNEVRIGDEFAHSTLASAYYTKNNYSLAAHHWEQYIELTENKGNISNYVYYRLGIAQEICGNRAKALTAWRAMTRSTDEDRPWDSVYWRRAQTRIRRPMTQAEVLTVIASNLDQAGATEDAVAYYERAAALAGDDDTKAIALYGKLDALRQCDDHRSVVGLAPQILALRPVEEDWTLPHALYSLGRSYADLGQAADARRAFDQALSYDDYDWEVRLRERIERQLEELEKKN